MDSIEFTQEIKAYLGKVNRYMTHKDGLELEARITEISKLSNIDIGKGTKIISKTNLCDYMFYIGTASWEPFVSSISFSEFTKTARSRKELRVVYDDTVSVSKVMVFSKDIEKYLRNLCMQLVSND